MVAVRVFITDRMYSQKILFLTAMLPAKGRADDCGVRTLICFATTTFSPVHWMYTGLTAWPAQNGVPRTIVDVHARCGPYDDARLIIPT